jgi:regulator of protease activity HflC (stomatin/prohibitin superfamily)
VNDVANKWAVDDIFNKREQFESDIITEANKRLSKWFTISQLRTNIIPPKALQESIEQKTRAIQNVQVAENERLVAIAQGDKTIAQARADSAAKVITAAGDAEAMRRKQLVLTENYLEYMKIQSWDGKLPVYSGSGSGLILNLPK